MKALDIEAVQAFVLTADLKSFTRAAEALDTSQSTVSLKIKRLEDGLGRRLLERTPRLVRLSADGSAFLGPARNLVAAHHGAVDAFGLERRRHDNRRRGGETILEEAFGWMAAPDFEHHPGEPLRLATQAEPCSVRSMAIEALKAAGIAWTEVFVGGGVATTGAAVSAGLAVAALSRRVAPPGTIDVGTRFELPKLPTRDVVLHSNISDRRTKSSLKTLAATIRAT